MKDTVDHPLGFARCPGPDPCLAISDNGVVFSDTPPLSVRGQLVTAPSPHGQWMYRYVTFHAQVRLTARLLNLGGRGVDVGRVFLNQ